MSQTHYRSFIKDNAVVIGGHILIYMKGIILMPVIIKTVGVTVYGGYALLASILGFSFGISSLGVGFRCMRFLPSAPDGYAKRELFYPQLCFQCVSLLFISLLFILFGSNIKTLFFKDEINFSLLLCAIYLLIYMVYSQTNNYYRYTHRVKYSIIQAVLFVYLHVAFITAIYLVFHNISVNLLISSEICSLALVSIPLSIFILKDIGFSFHVLKIKQIVDDIKLGFPLVLSYVVDVVIGVSDRFIIAFFLSVTDVGYYNPGYALGSFISLFPKAIGMVLPQLLSKSVDAGREEEAQKLLDYSLKGFLFLAIPFIVGSTILSKPLLNLLGNAVVAQKAFLVTPLVATGMLFYGLYIILSNALFVRMKTGAMLRMNAIVAFLSLTLNCLFLYFFRSILVTAVTALISFFVVFILILRVVKKDWRVNFDINAIIKSILSSLVMCVFLYWMSQLEVAGIYRILNILGEVVVGIVIYFSGLFALKAFSQNELLFLKRLFA